MHNEPRVAETSRGTRFDFHGDSCSEAVSFRGAEESVLPRACRRLGLSGLISGRVRRRLHLADDDRGQYFTKPAYFRSVDVVCHQRNYVSLNPVGVSHAGAPRKKDPALLIRAIYPARIKSRCIAACSENVRELRAVIPLVKSANKIT